MTIPLSFGYVLPREGEVFSPRTQGALIRVYRVLSIWAYVSLVVAIVDAIVSDQQGALGRRPHHGLSCSFRHRYHVLCHCC